jgi:hypothetical protein
MIRSSSALERAASSMRPGRTAGFDAGQEPLQRPVTPCGFGDRTEPGTITVAAPSPAAAMERMLPDGR